MRTSPAQTPATNIINQVPANMAKPGWMSGIGSFFNSMRDHDQRAIFFGHASNNQVKRYHDDIIKFYTEHYKTKHRAEFDAAEAKAKNGDKKDLDRLNAMAEQYAHKILEKYARNDKDMYAQALTSAILLALFLTQPVAGKAFDLTLGPGLKILKFCFNKCLPKPDALALNISATHGTPPAGPVRLGVNDLLIESGVTGGNRNSPDTFSVPPDVDPVRLAQVDVAAANIANAVRQEQDALYGNLDAIHAHNERRGTGGNSPSLDSEMDAIFSEQQPRLTLPTPAEHRAAVLAREAQEEHDARQARQAADSPAGMHGSIGEAGTGPEEMLPPSPPPIVIELPPAAHFPQATPLTTLAPRQSISSAAFAPAPPAVLVAQEQALVEQQNRQTVASAVPTAAMPTQSVAADTAHLTTPRQSVGADGEDPNNPKQTIGGDAPTTPEETDKDYFNPYDTNDPLEKIFFNMANELGKPGCLWLTNLRNKPGHTYEFIDDIKGVFTMDTFLHQFDKKPTRNAQELLDVTNKFITESEGQITALKNGITDLENRKRALINSPAELVVIDQKIARAQETIAWHTAHIEMAQRTKAQVEYTQNGSGATLIAAQNALAEAYKRRPKKAANGQAAVKVVDQPEINRLRTKVKEAERAYQKDLCQIDKGLIAEEKEQRRTRP